MQKEAIIIENRGRFECRCATCGKLLFTFSKKFPYNVDETAQNVIIVARCTRSSCKTDNIFKM